MSEHIFGAHHGHYDSRRDLAAIEAVEAEFADAGVCHIDYDDPNGQRRGWWVCENRGHPFDQQTARAVLARFAALRGKRGARA